MTLTIMADSHMIRVNELPIEFGADGIVHGAFQTPHVVPHGMVERLQVVYGNGRITFNRCVIEPDSSMRGLGLVETAYVWVCKGGPWNE